MSGTSKFKEQGKTSNADYTVVDRSPVCLKVGEIVDLGMEDKVWAGKGRETEREWVRESEGVRVQSE